MNKTHWWHDLADLTIFFWNKTGTTSALALMAGGVAMSIFYTHAPQEAARHFEAFEGFYNHASSQLPEGLGEKIAPSEQHSRAQVRFEYDDKGRLARVYHVDDTGTPSAIPGSHVAQQTLQYDAKGRLIAKKNSDASGNPVHDAAGVHERRFRYDGQGNLIETSYWDCNLARTAPYTPGYAIERIRYDEQNRPIEKRYLDASERPTHNSHGESLLSISYNKDDKVIKNYHLGSLRKNNDGYAIERHHYSNNGLTERIDWYDAKGQPAINERVGYASMQIERTADGKQQRVLYLDHEGMQLQHKRALSEHLTKFNDKGQPRWEFFLAHDGLPLHQHPHDYAECAREYDEEDRLHREHFRNAYGELADCYEQRYSYPDGGERILSLYKDGSTATRLAK